MRGGAGPSAGSRKEQDNVWSDRWRKCAEFLKELDRGLVQLHQMAHKYKGIKIPSPEAEAFAKEWPEWWKTLEHVIVLRNRDPHGALLVMRARGLLPLDSACGMELAPEWVGFLLRLYDPKCAPKCLLRTPPGQPCRAVEFHCDLLTALIYSYWGRAVSASDSPDYPRIHEWVRSLLKRGMMMFEAASNDPGIARQLVAAITGVKAVPEQAVGAAGRGLPAARPAKTRKAQLSDARPSSQEALGRKIDEVKRDTGMILDHVLPKNPLIAQGIDGSFYYHSKKIEMSSALEEIFVEAHRAKGRWVEILDTVFNESDRRYICGIRQALKAAGDPTPASTLQTRGGQRAKGIRPAYRLNPVRLGIKEET
jgi:hypothetical protein